MKFRMRDQLSACVIGDHAVFLDIDADRYFRLPASLERAFLMYMRNPDSQPAVATLVASNILVPARTGYDEPPAAIEPPTRSALEMGAPAGRWAVTAIPEVLTVLWTSRRALSKRFRDVLQRTAGERDRLCRSSPRPGGPATERQALQIALRFHHARAYCPFAPCCLPDSIALTRFLARRGVDSRIVFGVTSEPFSAHCWVQVGDIALNETVGYARTHTVIRVV